MPAATKKTRKSSAPRGSDEIMAVVTLVPHGYQLTFYRNSKPPKELATSCRDFGGNYAPKKMANTVMAGFLVQMERIERYHRRAERFSGLSETKVEQMLARGRLIRKAILACLVVEGRPLPSKTLASFVQLRAGSCPTRPTPAEVEDEAMMLRDFGVLTYNDQGFSL